MLDFSFEEVFYEFLRKVPKYEVAVPTFIIPQIRGGNPRGHDSLQSHIAPPITCARIMVPLDPWHEGRSITKASLKEVVSLGRFLSYLSED